MIGTSVIKELKRKNAQKHLRLFLDDKLIFSEHTNEKKKKKKKKKKKIKCKNLNKKKKKKKKQ